MIWDISVLGEQNQDDLKLINGSRVIAQSLKVFVEGWDDFNQLWEYEGFNPWGFFKIVEVNNRIMNELKKFIGVETEKGRVKNLSIERVEAYENGGEINIFIEYEGSNENTSLPIGGPNEEIP